mmetsp:Transcript_2752/g.6615  ORF Transcript_2752/g.6615 Transcript_2752/m.6615 type:complete len:214 (+) Transcript_2752:393-1034(+)
MNGVMAEQQVDVICPPQQVPSAFLMSGVYFSISELAISGVTAAPISAVLFAMSSGEELESTPAADSAASRTPLLLNQPAIAWISGMHEAPKAATADWQDWSQPVQGRRVAKAAGLLVSREVGSRFLHDSGRLAMGSDPPSAAAGAVSLASSPAAGASVEASAGASVEASAGASVEASAGASVEASAGASWATAHTNRDAQSTQRSNFFMAIFL